MIDGLTLRGEISAFYRGAGQPARLDRAFRDAPLLVPLTDDDDVCIAVMGGIQWLFAFSTEEEMSSVSRGSHRHECEAIHHSSRLATRGRRGDVPPV